MKKILVLIVVFFGILSWQACEYEWVEPEQVVVPDTVSYKSDIQPIFDRSCNGSGCHSQGGFSPDLTPENSYNDLFATGMIDTNDPPSSELYIRITTGNMKTYAKPGDSDLILKWIEDGAPNN